MGQKSENPSWPGCQQHVPYQGPLQFKVKHLIGSIQTPSQCLLVKTY